MSAASSSTQSWNIVKQLLDGTSVSFLVAPWIYIKTVKAIVGNHEAAPTEKVQLAVNENLFGKERDFRTVGDLKIRDQDVITASLIDPESSEDENPDDHKCCIICGKHDLRLASGASLQVLFNPAAKRVGSNDRWSLERVYTRMFMFCAHRNKHRCVECALRCMMSRHVCTQARLSCCNEHIHACAQMVDMHV